MSCGPWLSHKCTHLHTVHTQHVCTHTYIHMHMHTHLYPLTQSQSMHEMYTCAPTPTHTQCGRHTPCMHACTHANAPPKPCSTKGMYEPPLVVQQPVTQSLFTVVRGLLMLVGSSDSDFYLFLDAVVVICAYVHTLSCITAHVIGHCLS